MNHEVLPKYYRIKQQLKDLIPSWEKSGKDPIPSERELIDQFGVSRITIRRAIDELVKEGYLFRIQGKGTYVETDHKNQNLINITSCASEIQALGMQPGRAVLRSEVIPCSNKQAFELKINTSESLYFLDRIFFADDIALNRTQTYLPYKLVPEIETLDFSRLSLYEILENRYSIQITRAHRTIEAISANKDIAKSLAVEPGAPVLLFHCLTHGLVDTMERPIELYSCYYRSDKFKFFINQVR